MSANAGVTRQGAHPTRYERGTNMAHGTTEIGADHPWSCSHNVGANNPLKNQDTKRSASLSRAGWRNPTTILNDGYLS